MSESPLDIRFRNACATLEGLLQEVLAARERARDDPGTWAGWSVSFNHRLRATRSDLAIHIPPPEGADARLFPLYDAGVAIRDLRDACDRALRGQPANISQKRVEAERALRLAWDALHPKG
ncbi:MAG: hypothetical protein ACKVVT_14630 [Dehalococcoidia bacterium]